MRHLGSSWPQPSAAYLLDQLNVPYTPILSVCEPSDRYSRHMWETLFATLWFVDYFFTIVPQPGIQLACSGALRALGTPWRSLLEVRGLPGPGGLALEQP